SMQYVTGAGTVAVDTVTVAVGLKGGPVHLLPWRTPYHPLVRGLKGKGVVITGGASGIGAAAVARFLDEDARVVVVERDPAGSKRIKNRFPSLVEAVVADVADGRAVHTAFAQIDGLLEGVDVLINNAGISIRHRFLDLPSTDWSKILAVNLDGVFNMAQDRKS